VQRRKTSKPKPAEVPPAEEMKAQPAPDDMLKSVPIVLPSKGKTYGELILGGRISIKPPTTDEVEFFVEMGGAGYETKLTQLLRMLVVEPTNINPIKLTSGDRTFLHIWTRMQLHDSYVINVGCPACGKLHENYYYKLVDIPLISIDSDLSPLTELELPICKKKVTLRITTGEDDAAADELIASRGIKKWTAKRSVSIAKIEGEAVDYFGAAMWMGKQHASDSLFVKAFQDRTYHGPDFANCPFKCECGTESLIRLPFRPEFYFPSIPFTRLVGDAIVSSSVREGRAGPGNPSSGKDGVSEVAVAQATSD
jgi:hypothetical protein